MMNFAFDLISDLHVESWDPLDWTGQPTSPYCVVAGDVAKDRQTLVDTLTHLGQQYSAVFYIDGNEEHREHFGDLTGSYRELSEILSDIPNVVYMQDNVVIINGVAIIATNGWWTYDFDDRFDYEEGVDWFQQYMNLSYDAANEVTGVAYHDAAYIINSVNKLQTHNDVKAIVIVSHTVPAAWIVEHDIDLFDTVRFNTMGNSHIDSALDEDTEHKVRAWCFGHYHKNVDRNYAGIRYVNNCRGRGNTPWVQNPYFPKRIEIKF
jgi:UDP-2,3-diacylglucosamine pyrophosphatase LpxH